MERAAPVATHDNADRGVPSAAFDAREVLRATPGVPPREAASAYVRNALLAAVAEYHELRSLDADLDAAAKEGMDS
jgi:hypothetical protein